VRIFTWTRVQVDDRVQRLERSALPRLHVFEHRVRHRRDQARRHLDLIDLLQVPLDLARRHPPRVQRDHLLVEARQPPLALRHQLRLEAALAVPGHLDLDLTRVRLEALLRAAVARVAAVAALRRVLLIAQMLRELAFQRALEQPLRQVLE
jgi:hypothetical protein